ncbi:mitochondrial 37S ribosomal protein bS18m RSM18 [Rhodotorula paludigena]|uniref:mitochondrial 37S ribosomal protein bS18m RSM18 n=1 Tax=Rhodotorula paludigena TaxID=86838 RepID=UPI00317F77A5
MLRTARSLVQSTARAAQASASCSCRALSSSAAWAAPARTPSRGAEQAQPARRDTTEALLGLLQDADADSPASLAPLEPQTSVLRHLSSKQVISPQHLSPRHLLVPYLPRPDFSQAHPLGPPTAFGPTHDPFVRYGLDPLRDAGTNPYLLSEFVTSMGKIKSRGKTGLQRKSQRRVGKAIRRARSMGLMPTFGVSVPTSRG